MTERCAAILFKNEEKNAGIASVLSGAEASYGEYFNLAYRQAGEVIEQKSK